MSLAVTILAGLMAVWLLIAALAASAYRRLRLWQDPVVTLVWRLDEEPGDSAPHPLESLAASLGLVVAADAEVQYSDEASEVVTWLRSEHAHWGEVAQSHSGQGRSLSWHSRSAHRGQAWWRACRRWPSPASRRSHPVFA